ncbi:MAG: cysteine dioxygenase family protein [Paludibacter sp.]|nr:cysteine dioxygenase family protein [Paludibacter sp.]
MKTEFPKSLQQLILALQNESNIDNTMVADLVSANRLSDNEIAPYISYGHKSTESYGRQLIYDNGNFKILLMSWKKGDFTAIHNHGYTEWGCVYFFGEATHRLYEIENEELKILQKDNFHTGEVASVCGDLTHMMGNASSKDFTTLHIYGSNTRNHDVSENAKVYIPEEQKIVTTMGSAYLHMDKQLVLSENPLNYINGDVLSDYYSLVKPFYERNHLIQSIRNMEDILVST